MTMLTVSTTGDDDDNGDGSDDKTCTASAAVALLLADICHLLHHRHLPRTVAVMLLIVHLLRRTYECRRFSINNTKDKHVVVNIAIITVIIINISVVAVINPVITTTTKTITNALGWVHVGDDTLLIAAVQFHQ